MEIKLKKEKEIDGIMKSALASDMEPDDVLNQKIIRMWKESPDMNKTVKRKLPVAAVAAFCILIMTVTVGATVKYLTSAEIADLNGNTEIIQAFKGKEAIEIGEVQEAGDYQFTLMGVTTGKSLIESGLSKIMPNMDSTYATVAIERKDGTPMPSTTDDKYGELNFFMSPLIQGLKPWSYNAASMNGGYSDFMENGVLYRIVECNNVKLFADKKIYFCINDSTFFNTNAYIYNEESGEISRNTSYEGINLLFEIPFDASGADPAAAAEYLKNLEDSWYSDVTETEEGQMDSNNEDSGDGINSEAKDEVEQIISYMDKGKVEDALKGATLLEGSKKTVKSDDGRYDYPMTNEAGEVTGTLSFYEANFKDGKDYMICYSQFDVTSGQPAELTITLLSANGNGTADIETYIKKLK